MMVFIIMVWEEVHAYSEDPESQSQFVTLFFLSTLKRGGEMVPVYR
jgi:hypothetical protein